MEPVRARELRAFTRDVLLAHGAAEVREDGGVLVVTAGALAEVLGARSLTLAFDREMALRTPSAVLVAHGASILGRLLAIARRAEGVTRIVLPAVSPLDEAALAAELNGASGAPVHAVRRRATLLRAHVLATAVAGEREQQLHSVIWDTARHVVIENGDGPPPDVTGTVSRASQPSLSARELKTALEGMREEVARRMRRSITRLKRRADELLEDRIATLGDYYRDLIREEGERRVSPDAANGDRARQIKLEWERKISAERDRVRPSGALRLISLEELSVPRSLVETDGESPLALLFDHASGRFLPMTCARCGVAARVLVERETMRLCRRCDRVAAGGAPRA